jgi:flagellar hook-length control protein FliK
LLQFDIATPQPVKAEGSTEASQSPAANYFSEKKAGAKVEQGAKGFAKTLEKAQKSNQAPLSKPGERPKKAQQGKEVSTRPAGAAEKLQELLGGMDMQQLIRGLLKINPVELLRAIELKGLDTAVPLSALSPANASASPQQEGKWGLSRGKLIHLLANLRQLLGQQTVLDAMAALTGSKPSQPQHAPENDNAGGNKKPQVGAAPALGKKPSVVVLDLRKDQAKESEEQPNSMKNSLTLSTDRTAEARQERDAAVLFRAPLQDRAQTSAPGAGVPVYKATTSFEQRFIPEVVKQTGIILKSGGNGEIRLVLKPENLGSIRIRLALSESSLEGRIVVDNNSVKELVESSLDNLKNALRLEGYQTNLEVSVGHRRSWNGNDQDQTLPTGWVAGGGSEEFDKAIPLYLDMRPDYELVNVFA